MKVYLASSWRMEFFVKLWAKRLRKEGHEVDCFCDDSTGRYVFRWLEIEDKNELDAITFLDDPRARRAFEEDKKHIDSADVVLLILPADKSAHLEAGYAVGAGKKLIIWRHEFPTGELEVMYGVADLVTESVVVVLDYLTFYAHSLLYPPCPERIRGIAGDLRQLWKFAHEDPHMSELLIHTSIKLDVWARKIIEKGFS